MDATGIKSFIKKIAACAPAAAVVSALVSAVALAGEVQNKVNNMSVLQKAELASKLSGKSEDLFATLSSIALLFGVLIFSYIFFKRWRIPRMGYFLVTLVILVARMTIPLELFWKVGAFTAGLFSAVMFLLANQKHDFDSRKEPLYFLFNSFTLLIIAFSSETFTLCLSAGSLIASLFFVVTLKPVPHGKFLQHDADEKIMETLEKKARRRI